MAKNNFTNQPSSRIRNYKKQKHRSCITGQIKKPRTAYFPIQLILKVSLAVSSLTSEFGMGSGRTMSLEARGEMQHLRAVISNI